MPGLLVAIAVKQNFISIKTKLFTHTKTYALFPVEYTNPECFSFGLGLRPATLAGGEQDGRKEGMKEGVIHAYGEDKHVITMFAEGKAVRILLANGMGCAPQQLRFLKPSMLTAYGNKTYHHHVGCRGRLCGSLECPKHFLCYNDYFYVLYFLSDYAYCYAYYYYSDYF